MVPALPRVVVLSSPRDLTRRETSGVNSFVESLTRGRRARSSGLRARRSIFFLKEKATPSAAGLLPAAVGPGRNAVLCRGKCNVHPVGWSASEVGYDKTGERTLGNKYISPRVPVSRGAEVGYREGKRPSFGCSERQWRSGTPGGVRF